MKTLFISLLFVISLNLQASFDEHFLNKTLRLDYYHSGNSVEDSYSFDELIEELYWGGSKVNLIDTFEYGSYLFKVVDKLSGEVLYSRGYSTLFQEWQTTAEAKTTSRTYSETVVFPFPKKTVVVEFYKRNKKNTWDKRYEYTVDPTNYFISKEMKIKCDTFKVNNAGDPANKLDIVIIAEGYTAAEMGKFEKDCKRFAGYLFKTSIYKKNKNNINIWGVKSISAESGTDFPGLGTWKKTIVNASFYTFDTERYLMTTDNKNIRNIAANVPYDQIYILVNTDHYGGGGIFNFYSTCASDNSNSDFVFTHEFGHAFAGLGDEYYSSETSYNDFYPLDVEPWEPNLTTLVDFDKKWKSMVAKTTPIPTPNRTEYLDKVGVFEGGGYVAKGVYRPVNDCTMKSVKFDYFCPVCTQAIQKMIDFYSK